MRFLQLLRIPIIQEIPSECKVESRCQDCHPFNFNSILSNASPIKNYLFYVTIENYFNFFGKS